MRVTQGRLTKREHHTSCGRGLDEVGFKWNTVGKGEAHCSPLCFLIHKDVSKLSGDAHCHSFPVGTASPQRVIQNKPSFTLLPAECLSFTMRKVTDTVVQGKKQCRAKASVC